MKSRSVKLREAHKTTGSPALGSVLWDNDGRHIVTAADSDSSVAIHDLSHPSKPPKALRHHRDGITALALSPDSATLASGSIDHSVKLYSFPDGEFQSNVTRFTLPIRSLAFNKSGSLLAAAGDDDGIKLISTIDSSISRVLKGHKGPVSGLAFDPKNELLASVDEFGTVMFWELLSGKVIHTLKAVAPNCDSDNSVSNVLGWSPDGETLAVPGLRNDVVMYDRDTAEKMFTLKGDHERQICFLAWSPNGKYMATSALDKQVLIWDIDQRQDIERQKFDDRICCLAWKPNENSLAVIDVSGRFGVWEFPVPSYMKSPTDDALNLKAKNANGSSLFDEDEPKAIISGSLDDAIEESHESAPISRKRLRKRSMLEDSFDEDSDGQDDLLHQIESRKRHSVKREAAVGRAKDECTSSMNYMKPKLQEAFQPGSTPIQSGKRRFLCYNMLGSITTLENDGYSHIEVDFHDTGRGPRVPSMTDYFGFTMASLNENGSVFANPCKGEKNMSTLMYRPFSSWANNSEWSMRFEAEEVRAVAVGTGWVAAATSLNFLRIFTEGGLQRHVLCLNGPVVTAAGFKDELAIVTHASDCLQSGDQVLEVKVFNIVDGTQPIRCRLPLTPDSCLTWFGFSEEGQLSSYDSKGVLRVFSSQYGGSWLPLFSASKVKKSDDENFWIVGLNASKLFCVLCKAPDTCPLVTPKPVLTLLDLSCPVASSDLGADDLEDEFIMSSMHLMQIQKKIEELSAAGLDTTALDDEAFNMEAAIDRCILRLIASCCNGDKLVRATELARLLSMEKSLKGAIKLVTALKLPILAERFSAILEERLLNESKGLDSAPSVTPKGKITNSETLQKVSSTSQNSKVLEPTVTSPSLALPHPCFPKQHKTEEKVKSVGDVDVRKDTNVRTIKLAVNYEKSSFPANPFEKLSNGMVKKTQMGRETEPSKNTSKDNPRVVGLASVRSTSEGKSNEAADQGQPRPTNPFAKLTKNEEKSSNILDSIKKMKTTESTDTEKVGRVLSKKPKT